MELVVGQDILHYLRPKALDSVDSHEFLGERQQGVARSGLGSEEPDLSRSQPSTPPAWVPPSGTDDSFDDLPPASGPADYQRVIGTFRQLGEGLVALHHAGLLHMDIKPSNVLVTEEERVVLLDFGLSTEINAAERSTENPSEITGTPAYMAPEQLLDNRYSEASDWYSVGVLLYHVLTGRLPFQGNGLRVLVNKVSHPPIAPRELLASIPEELSTLCMSLLDPHPPNRPSGVEYLKRMASSESAIASSRMLASRQEFIGRAEELAILCSAFRSLQNGHSGLVNLHGGSGMGKTFLVRRFQREIMRAAPEALILSGRCYEQEHVPYKALDGLVDALSHYLKRLSPSRMSTLLPCHIGALAQLFPVLRQVPRIAELQKRHAVIADPLELRHRAFSALRDMLRRIAEGNPLVLVIDDLQWGDADSAVLMADLISPPQAPHMLVVACFRTEERGTSPVLKEFLSLGRSLSQRCVDVPICELPEGEARQLACTFLGQDCSVSEDLVAWIIRESNGNPFFIQELAQHVGRPESSSNTCENLETYIQMRVESLPQEPRTILELTALAGYPLDWPVLREAAEANACGAEALDILRQGHLIRIRTLDRHRMVEPYHDIVRQSVSSSLTTEQVREGHLRLARALEKVANPDVQALAIHYRAAGETQKAIDYLTTAGLQAASSLAFSKAASLLRMALNLRHPQDPGSAATWSCLGEALANAGRGKEAAEAYLNAARHSESREGNRLLRAAAQEYLKSGHYHEGVQVLDGVLKSIGARLAGTQIQALLSTLFHKIWITLRGLDFQERDLSAIPPATLDRLDGYWAVTLGLATGDIMRVADFQARHLLLSLRTGEPSRLVRAFSYEAIFASSRGNRSARETRRYIDLALMLAERTGDPNAMSQVMVASGIALTALGQWRKSAEILDRAEAQLRENTTGLSYELRAAQSYALINHYAMGNLTLLAERLPLLIRDAEESGDLLSLANLKMGSAFIHYLALDEPDLARREVQRVLDRLPLAGFSHQRFHEFTALGNIDLYSGNLSAGWADMQERWHILHRSRMLMVQTIRITCLELRGRMALALAAASENLETRRKLLRCAQSDAKRIQREGIDYGMGLAARLLAIEAALWGRWDDARALGLLAETYFETCDMALHAQTMKYFRGLARGASGQALVGEAEEWMRRQGVVSPRRLAAMSLPGLVEALKVSLPEPQSHP
jgi:tetratricopeptide (TPR) repeat protein